jgi:hypothetical protein
MRSKIKLLILFFSIVTIFAVKADPVHKCDGPSNHLFRGSKPLAFEIIANFDEINGAGLKSAAQSPAEIVYWDSKNTPYFLLGHLEARGNSRFQSCKWRPLKFLFEDENFQQSFFAQFNQNANANLDYLVNTYNQFRNYVLSSPSPDRKYSNQSYGLFSNLGKSIKIVTHCGVGSSWVFDYQNQADVDRAILFEYSLYKVLETLKSTTLKTRLGRVRYRNEQGTVLEEQYAFFRETDKAIKRRCNLVDEDDLKVKLGHEDADSGFQSKFLNILISNYDYGNGYHNSKKFYTKNGRTIYVPYDYDLSWVIRPEYFKNPGKNLEDDLNAFRNFLNNLSSDDKVRAIVLAKSVLEKVNDIAAELDSIPMSQNDFYYFSNWFNAKLTILSEFIAKN